MFKINRVLENTYKIKPKTCVEIVMHGNNTQNNCLDDGSERTIDPIKDTFMYRRSIICPMIRVFSSVINFLFRFSQNKLRRVVQERQERGDRVSFSRYFQHYSAQ